MVLLGVAFFLSGAAALVYQVVWQRILTLHTGIGVVSVSLIVAAFMAGLGLGSHLGGVLSARVSPRRALRVFALLELGVGLFAAISCRLYYDGLGSFAAGLYATTAGAAVAHFAAFLLPTTLMGMSLPFLVRATVRETASASRVIGVLYGVNVLGAATGALLAPWVLIRFLGLAGAALAGAVANLVAAAAALAAGHRTAPVDEAAAKVPSPPAAPRRRSALSGSFRLWTLLYALSGFLALSLEIAWFRLMDVGVKSTAYTFGTVLCLYLLGLGAGSLVGGRRAERLARPLEAFLDYQLLLIACAGAAVALLARLPPATPVYAWLFDYWRHEPFFHLGADWNAGALLRLYGLLPLALFGVPTVLMGLSFGALQRAVQDDPATSGRKVGLLQAANIAGCTAGSLATGLVLLERIGTARHGPTSRRRLRPRLPPGAGPDRGPHPRLLRPGRRPGPRAPGAALERAPVEAAPRRDRGRAPVLHRRGRERGERHLPGRRGALARHGQRPAPQLASLRGHPHPARRRARPDPPGARGDRRDRAGVG